MIVVATCSLASAESPLASTADSGSVLEIDGVQLTLIDDVPVPATVAGQVANIVVREGSLLAAGGDLVRINTDSVAAEFDAAEQALKIAEIAALNDVDLRFARKSRAVTYQELVRSESANERFPNSVSTTEIERLRLSVDQAELAEERAERDLEAALATVRQRRAELRMIGVRRDQHTITAPIAGMVVEILSEPGGWLDIGEPVARLIRLDRLRVEALIDGGRYGAGLSGKRFTFRSNDDSESIAEGVIVFVSPEIHPVTGKIRIWGEIDNTDLRYNPGINGSMSIELQPVAE